MVSFIIAALIKTFSVKCPYCGSGNILLTFADDENGEDNYYCNKCGHKFNVKKN